MSQTNSSFAQEYERVRTNIANCYDAILSRGGSAISRSSSDGLADAVNTIPSGIEINGIIEQYKVAAGENINAGDFVYYANNITKSSTVTGQYFFKLTETQVIEFLTTDDYNMNARIININNSNYTISTATTVTINTYAGINPRIIKVVKISDTLVGCLWYGNENYGQASMAIIEINNNSLTMGNKIVIRNSNYAGDNTYSLDGCDLLYINSKLIGIVGQYYYRNQMRCYATAYVCTVQNTTLTKISNNTVTPEGQTPDDYGLLSAINSNKCIYIFNQNGIAYYRIITFSNDTDDIDWGTLTAFDTTISFQQLGVFNNILYILIFKKDAGYNILTVTTTTVEYGLSNFNNSISFSTILSMTTVPQSNILISLEYYILNQNQTNIYVCQYKKYKINFTTYEISSLSEPLVITTSTPLTGFGNIFSSVLNPIICNINNQFYFISNMYIILKSISWNIIGIAAESGTSGDIIDVYIPSIN